MKHCFTELVEAARSGVAPAPELRQHLDACAECRDFFEVQAALQRSLIPPAACALPDLEARLLSEFQITRKGARFDWRWATAAAAAVSIAGAIALIRPSAPPRHVADRPFLEIPYTAPLAPYERTRVIRMDVPVAALIAAGFDVHAPDAGAALRADVLFGQDGRAHAIRLVSDNDSNRRTD